MQGQKILWTASIYSAQFWNLNQLDSALIPLKSLFILETHLQCFTYSQQTPFHHTCSVRPDILTIGAPSNGIPRVNP